MDFIKGNEQVKIDPNGIDISGTSNILLKSDGKVGIGTNNPQYPLQVNGTHAIFNDNPEIQLLKQNTVDRTGPTLQWGNTSYTDWKIKPDTTGLNILSGANGATTESITINNTGNVGIGTNNPLVKLQIGGATTNPSDIISDIENGVSIIHPIPTSSTNINDPQTTLYLGRNGTSSQSNPAGAFFKICRYENNATNSKTRLDIDLRSNYSPVEKIMTLLDNGNVGIGTTNPENLLHLKSTGDVVLRIEADSDDIDENYNPLIHLSQDKGNVYAKFGINGDPGEAFPDAKSNSCFIQCDKSLQFAPGSENGNESAKMTISEAGYVGIGTTTPNYKLDLRADGSEAPMRILGYNRTENATRTDLNAYMLTLGASAPSNTTFNQTFGPTIRFNSARSPGGSQMPSANIKGCVWQGANTGADYHMLAIDVYADNTVKQRGLEVRSHGPTPYCACPGSFSGSEQATTSDDRMKFNESDIVDGLSLINKLKPQKYEKYTPPFEIMKGNWMPKESEWEHVKKNQYINEYGFIAQHVRSIPELSFLVTGDETIEEIHYIPEAEYNKLTNKEQKIYSKFYFYCDASGDEINDIKYNTLEADKKNLYKRMEKPNYRKTIITDQTLHLNYQGLFTVNVAAVQELSRRNDDNTKKIKDLEVLNKEKDEKIFSLEERITAIEKLLQNSTTLDNNISVTQNAKSNAIFKKV